MSFSIERIAGGSGTVDLIFIHGLSGDPKGSWTSNTEDPSDAYWPLWLAKDLPNANVYTLGYPADVWAKWIEQAMSLYERAKAVLEQLAGMGLGSRPIALVCHSLGGLLAKQIIRTGNEADDSDWSAIASNTKFVAFLATPHSGSSVASTLKFLLPRTTSATIETLKAGSPQLDELNASYKTTAAKRPIETVVFYEKFATKGAIIVTKESANPGVTGVNPIPVDADHISICKPANRNSPVYLSLVRKLRKFEETCPSIVDRRPEEPFQFDGTDFTQKASDRRDLLEKLTAANREHEYAFANEAQNKFAQSYIRLGLHAAAKEANDNLLDEVQQRFETHVYLPLICKAASDPQIQQAIQTQVIDAVVTKFVEQRVPARKVVEALYFLTEQCHIRWDPQ